MSNKVVCSNHGCRWCGDVDEALSAPDPFNEGCTLTACPDCCDQSLVAACDEPGCTSEVSRGTPTPAGYRNTCTKHAP